MEVNKKVEHTIKFYAKFQGTSKSTFMLFCSYFYAFHSSLCLKFVHNFEILCQDDDLHLKLSLHFKVSNFGVRRYLTPTLELAPSS